MRRNYKGISINTSQNTHEKVFSLVSSDADMCVVDIPCGSGAFIQRLKDSGYRNVLGVDICDDLSIEHDEFLVGDMTAQLPLEDSSVDTLVCIDGIEHINRQQDFIAEAFRVLRSGGELIVSTPNISALRSRWKWLLTGHHNKCNSPLDESRPSPMHHIGLLSLPENPILAALHRLPNHDGVYQSHQARGMDIPAAGSPCVPRNIACLSKVRQEGTHRSDLQ